MQLFQKVFQESLIEAEHALQSADRLVHTLYPELQDSKILLHALQQAHKAELLLISIALKIEHIKKNIRLSQTFEENIDIFFKKCAKRYGLEKEQVQSLRHLLLVGKNYTQSGCTFPQKDKAVILNDDGTFNEVSEDLLKSELQALQQLLKSFKNALYEPRKI